MKTKGELLEEYAGRKPQAVYQIDAWRDDTAEPDDDDGYTWEAGWDTALMNVQDLRIFVAEGTPPRAAVRLLRNVADAIEKDTESFTFIQECRCVACGAVQPRPIDIDF